MMGAERQGRGDDARRAVVFLAIKAALFIGVPVLAAAAAVMLTLK